MKRVLIILGIVAIVLLITSLVVSNLGGTAVRHGVELIAPKITGTSVTLSGAGLSPFTGGGSLQDLKIGNPQGYSAQNIIEIGEASLRLNPLSLVRQPIHIHRMTLREAFINYERKLLTSNLDTLLDNIKKNLGGEKTSSKEDKSADSSEMKFIIDEIVITGATIRVSTAGIGGTLPLPDMTLNDLGKDQGGITMGQLTGEIIAAISRKSLSAIASAGKELLKGGEKAGKEIGESAEKAAREVKGLFGGK